MPLDCAFCGKMENHRHIFIECEYVTKVRSIVMGRFAYDNTANTIEEETIRLSMIAKKKTPMARVYTICWSELMYEVWVQRCKMVFQNHCDPEATVARRVLFKAASRVCDKFKEFLL